MFNASCAYFYLEANIKDFINSLSASLTKWSNTLKQFVGKLPTNCLSVFDHFVRLALKGLSFTFFLLRPYCLQRTPSTGFGVLYIYH